MYIHNYQIHNVLNAYRKQLSQSPGKTGAERPFRAPSGDVATALTKGHPPAMVNQISTEIIDRIARFGPQSEFDNAMANQLATPKTDGSDHNAIDFTYSTIDEQNRKTTQTLPMNSSNILKYQDTMQSPASNNTITDQVAPSGPRDDSHNTQSEWKG